MYKLASSLALAASLYVGGVAAHGGVVAYDIGGTWYDGWRPYNSPTGQTSIQRPWATFDPILSASSSSLACNNDGNKGPNQLTAKVKAGSAIKQYWNQVWPHDTGPVIVYLSKCPGSSCDNVNAQTAQWFKIEEAGLLSGTVAKGVWAAGKMIADNSSWTTVIPASVPSGHYLIRSETIALHSMPAQFYPECAQIEITDGGNVSPSADQLVTFPGGYSQSHPGVNIDLYGEAAKTQTTYAIPGPRLYDRNGPPSSTTAAPTAPTSVPTTPTATTPAPSATAVAPQYGQCGGTGWAGPTACAAPYTCKKLNDFYSQCV
ncbi:hypothetical protein H1R20_g14458, partial [Candolleomyces eurysporus]